jgi:hypothetical protein
MSVIDFDKLKKEQASETDQPKDQSAKIITITLYPNGQLHADCKGIVPVEIFGMMHEAKRIITRQIEFNEAMAAQDEIRKAQELAAVRSALANPKKG